MAASHAGKFSAASRRMRTELPPMRDDPVARSKARSGNSSSDASVTSVVATGDARTGECGKVEDPASTRSSSYKKKAPREAGLNASTTRVRSEPAGFHEIDEDVACAARDACGVRAVLD